jgi:uncharacterized damage-inducible protein DinB
MSQTNPVADLLAAIIHDTCWENKWHRLTTAVEDLTDDDLTYQPLQRFKTAHAILKHAASCAAHYGDALGSRTSDPSEDEWAGLTRRRAVSAASLVRAVDVACRRLHARAQCLTDDQLHERSGVWKDAYRGFVLIDGGILHAAWHFGQVAMLCAWRRAGQDQPMNTPSGAPGKQPASRGLRDWTDLRIGSRKETCLRLLDAAYRESPWHALRRQVQGMSAEELAWSPFARTWGPMVAIHGAHCKVIYADQAFGPGTLSWGDCDRVLGTPGDRPDGARMSAILDRAQGFLVDHMACASEEQIERTYPMHHGVPQTGWQVAATMAQHDAWHAGQIALMRDAYRRLA